MTTLQAIIDNPAFALVAAGVFTALGYFIKAGPARIAAKAAAIKTDTDVASGLRDDLAAEVKTLKEELHKTNNEVMIVKAQFLIAESESRNLTFIIQLVMDELHSINPDNLILMKARQLLVQMTVHDLGERASRIAELVRADRRSRASGETSEVLRCAKETEAAAVSTVNEIEEREL